MKRKDKKKIKDMDVKVITSVPLVDSIDKDCNCDETCKVCTCESNGIDPFEAIPKNVDTYRVASTLRHFEDEALLANDKIKNNGWNVAIKDESGYPGLRAEGDTRYAAFIPASAVGINYENGDIIDSAALIVNTIDQGPCFVTPNGAFTDPLCPVVTPAFVGNCSQPYGLYIPFNAKAMEDGIILTSRCLDYINKTNQNCSRLECMLGAADSINEESINNKDEDDDYNYHIEEIEW